MKKRITANRFYKLGVSLMTGVTILILTVLVIMYAKGYRLEKQGISETGQLVLKSEPDAASVFVNNKFVAATNSTLNLPPGEYDVKIVKDGYSPWTKKIKIEKEVVSPTDAILYPIVPELRRFTATGAINPTLSLDKTKIAYGVASSSAYPSKNGVYAANIANSQNIFFAKGTDYLARDNDLVQFSSGKFLFSPDSKQLLVYFENTMINADEEHPAFAESYGGQGINADKKTDINEQNLIYGGVDLNNVLSAYLLDAGRQTQEDVPDVSLNLAQILESWQKEKNQERTLQFNLLKKDLRKIASSSMEILDFTIDESKFLYTAREDAEIPIMIKPRLIGTNPTEEVRSIEKGKLYVYDIREDRNYFVKNSGENVPIWLDTSRHYLTVENNKIYISEYDSVNKILVFSGFFDKNFVVPAPNANKIFFLTSFSPDTPLNLYALLVR